MTRLASVAPGKVCRGNPEFSGSLLEDELPQQYAAGRHNWLPQPDPQGLVSALSIPSTPLHQATERLVDPARVPRSSREPGSASQRRPRGSNFVAPETTGVDQLGRTSASIFPGGPPRLFRTPPVTFSYRPSPLFQALSSGPACPTRGGPDQPVLDKSPRWREWAEGQMAAAR